MSVCFNLENWGLVEHQLRNAALVEKTLKSGWNPVLEHHLPSSSRSHIYTSPLYKYINCIYVHFTKIMCKSYFFFNLLAWLLTCKIHAGQGASLINAVVKRRSKISPVTWDFLTHALTRHLDPFVSEWNTWGSSLNAGSDFYYRLI